MMRWIGMLAVASLVGCSTPAQQPPPVVISKHFRVELPRECVAADGAWQDLVGEKPRLSDLARNYRTNKDTHRRVLQRRRVCRAAIKANENISTR